MINLRKYFVIKMTTLFSILGLIIAVIGFPLIYNQIFRDKNPNSFNYNNSAFQLEILNKQGEILWTKKLNEKPRTIDESIITISDLDNNRRNEVLIGYNTDNDTTKFATLSCYDFKGNLKWNTPFSKKVRNLNETDENSLYYYYSSYYFIGDLICYDLNNDGEEEIILSYFNEKHWSSFLAVIDSKGHYLYQVLNGGHISSIGLYDIDNDNITDIFAGGIFNIKSVDINAVILYINGKRIFNNVGLWRDKICMAPVQDGMQTVDGYFFPQKSIIPLLLYGENIGETVYEKFTFYDRIKIRRSYDHIQPVGITLYLNNDFKGFEYIMDGDYFDDVTKVKQDVLVTEERLNKYYKERYIYPRRLYYYNFEKACLDTLFM